jgi:hypothetical protein
MSTWLALLGSPSLVLANLSVNYALVAYACALRSSAPLQLVNAAMFGGSAVLTLIVLIHLRSGRDQTAQGRTAHARDGFLLQVAAGVSAISTLALLVMWSPIWILSPCR